MISSLEAIPWRDTQLSSLVLFAFSISFSSPSLSLPLLIGRRLVCGGRLHEYVLCVLVCIGFWSVSGCGFVGIDPKSVVLSDAMRVCACEFDGLSLICNFVLNGWW